eukprot:GHVP01021465.1.p1 GENE.GHVP01021465.1~~GHVP01021465.1.p1  ORF type:complete len:375 (-),score=55.37 GHVP01021465.1:69-1193(-)
MGFGKISLAACTALAQLHIASLGSWGSGSAEQKIVAESLRASLLETPTTLVLSPGYNFELGVSSNEDKQWQEVFTDVYSGPEFNIPMFTVLGEEDWARDFQAQAQRQQQTQEQGSLRWTLPNFWYHYVMHFTDSSSNNFGHSKQDVSVAFVFIDTHILSQDFPHSDITEKHWNDLKATLEASTQIFDWLIVVGDKALVSSGSSKGNKYLQSTLLPMLKEHKVDAYISGSDHDMEFIKDGQISLINCGSAGQSDSSPLRLKNENSEFFTPNSGFCRHTLTKDRIETNAIDGSTGSVLGTLVQQRQQKSKSYFSRFNIFQGMPTVGAVEVPEMPGGVVAPPAEDPSVKIIGSLGLLTLAFLTVGSLSTVAVKLSKH